MNVKSNLVKLLLTSSIFMLLVDTETYTGCVLLLQFDINLWKYFDIEKL